MQYEWNDQDLEEIRARSMTPEKIASYIEQFQQGFPAIQLDRPCTVGDGITTLLNGQDRLASLHAAAAAAGRITKFVPASGAASRMFTLLLSFSESPQLLTKQTLTNRAKGGDLVCQAFLQFMTECRHFAFSTDLQIALQKDGHNLDSALSQDKYDILLAYLLTPTGLDYANQPKGLIKFHAYTDHTRTPFEEHLVEAAEYAQDASFVAHVHFTVPAQHQQAIQASLALVQERYGQKGCQFDLSYSVQKPSTDTIAVDPHNIPFRGNDARLVFRPGGHGALLENLNDLQGDIIFIKNIDNVLPDRLKADTYRYKKLLCGSLLHLQQEIFSSIERLESSSCTEQVVLEGLSFAQHKLSLIRPTDFDALSVHKKRAFLIDRLNRPLRVCGVVRNMGEPGGGPFWVQHPDGTTSLQIIESSQVDMAEVSQLRIWESATHFNPVDLVCGVRDYRGRPFDLLRFIDPNTGFISEKSKDGHPLRALELPGLWNGAMAYWNTAFVEVPDSTFHPVKTVMDLLRPEHRNA